MFKKTLSFKAVTGEGWKFYPIAEVLTASEFYLAGVWESVESEAPQEPFTPLSESYTWRVGMSGCSDHQPKVVVNNVAYYLPYSWHYTMSGDLEGPIHHLALLPASALENLKVEEGKLHKMVGFTYKVLYFKLRSMGAIEITPVEHGVVLKGLHKRLGEYQYPSFFPFDDRKWKFTVPYTYTFWGKEKKSELSICYDPVREMVYVNGGAEFPRIEPGQGDLDGDQWTVWKEDKEGSILVTLYLFKRKCAATGRIYYSGYCVERGSDIMVGFEENQPTCRLSREVGDYLRVNESQRLGDLFVARPWQKEEVERLGFQECSWEDHPKLTYVGDEKGGILYHEEHGGVRVQEGDLLYRIPYVQRGHD